MPGSVGHLYLDVKLQTDAVEAQLKKMQPQPAPIVEQPTVQ